MNSTGQSPYVTVRCRRRRGRDDARDLGPAAARAGALDQRVPAPGPARPGACADLGRPIMSALDSRQGVDRRSGRVGDAGAKISVTAPRRGRGRAPAPAARCGCHVAPLPSTRPSHGERVGLRGGAARPAITGPVERQCRAGAAPPTPSSRQSCGPGQRVEVQILEALDSDRPWAARPRAPGRSRGRGRRPEVVGLERGWTRTYPSDPSGGRRVTDSSAGSACSAAHGVVGERQVVPAARARTPGSSPRLEIPTETSWRARPVS